MSGIPGLPWKPLKSRASIPPENVSAARRRGERLFLRVDSCVLRWPLSKTTLCLSTGTRIKISSSNKQEVPTEAGRAAGPEPGMKQGGDWGAGGGGDERHSGEDADGAAGTLPAEPGGWWACGRHGVLLFAAGRPRPRYHRAHLEARRCRPGLEVGDARRRPRSGRPWSRGEPTGLVLPRGSGTACVPVRFCVCLEASLTRTDIWEAGFPQLAGTLTHYDLGTNLFNV